MAPVSARRQPADLAFALRDPWSWTDFAALAREGESLGYRAVLLPEIAGRDTLAALTGLAHETSTLRLGSGIVAMGSRSPQLTAMAAETVHEASAGRAILGLGTGPATPGALERLRAVVLGLRAAFAGEAAHVEGVRLELGLRGPGPLPVWVAALGPRAVRLAGEVADGVLLNWCTPERVAEAATQARAAADAAGRDPGELVVAVYLRANLAGDRDAASAAMRAAAGEYASYPSYARQFERMGLGAAAAAAAAAHHAGRGAGATDAADTLVRAVALGLDPEASRTRLAAYRDAGADLPVVYHVAADGDGPEAVAQTLRALAPDA